VRYIDAFGQPASFAALMSYLDEHGLPPTPPYLKRELEAEGSDAQLGADRERYQTVYAQQDGSVAAPTAGLHFDREMLERLTRGGHELRQVTLHVGLGTFAPVRVADLAEHQMHAEAYSVKSELQRDYLNAKHAGSPVLAVGTTSLRVLHTQVNGVQQDGAAVRERQENAGRDARATDLSAAGISGMTEAFIYPGHGTDACDLLLTNFHLPRSTLLALVYAFGGEELLRKAYQHAIAERYRFYSYGDCMLIDRRS
jgi:S-adenosylmethionine:tRNA ribosyltransferase-isomerase